MAAHPPSFRCHRCDCPLTILVGEEGRYQRRACARCVPQRNRLGARLDVACVTAGCGGRTSSAHTQTGLCAGCRLKAKLAAYRARRRARDGIRSTP